MAKLITAGCGLSQQGFDKWHTWPKYCVLTHQCEHVNVGGPASGNEHIARSIIRSIYDQKPDCVVVTWTSYNKLDVYVEDVAKELQIKNFPTRNFLINYLGKTVGSPGWWPSSVSDDNLFKKFYKETLESKTYYYIKTLESILSVQNLCKLQSIPCYMFLGYGFDFDYIKESDELVYLHNAIDWEQFVTMQSLDCHYEQSDWFKFNSTKQHGMIPVAGWHYRFYTENILPILDNHYTRRDLTKFWELQEPIRQLTQEKFDQGIS